MNKLLIFHNFLNESSSNSILDNTILNKSVFKYGKDTYRLTGYYYIYEFSDSRERKFAHVHKEDANGVGGYSVCGVIVKLDKIEFVDRQTSWSNEFIQQLNKTYEKRVEDDKYLFDLLKSLPLRLTQEEFDDIHINRVIDEEMYRRRKKTLTNLLGFLIISFYIVLLS